MHSRYRLAEVIISTAGRDYGRYYLVVGIEGEKYVKIADGDKKKFEHPKCKNIKHLSGTGYVYKELALWLSRGKRIRNEDIKKAIKIYEKSKEAN
jgi:large subunit ribosomal protein L14e